MAETPLGYSGTPLAKKLGLKPGIRVLLIEPPRGFKSLLKPLPPGVSFHSEDDPPHAFVHLFVRSQDALREKLKTLREELKQDGTVWISWPKKSSGVESDVDENAIRGAALPLGFVDIKVCAVDATWSALKLVIRRSERD